MQRRKHYELQKKFKQDFISAFKVNDIPIKDHLSFSAPSLPIKKFNVLQAISTAMAICAIFLCTVFIFLPNNNPNINDSSKDNTMEGVPCDTNVETTETSYESHNPENGS